MKDKILDKIQSLGLSLPEPLKNPAGVQLPFSWIRISGKRAFISGHLPQLSDGSLTERLGKVGQDVSVEEGYAAARLVGLAILGNLKRALGSLERITAWHRVFGMVNSAPGFDKQPAIINGFSDLILEIFGPEVGGHARSAVGMAELPFNVPVEIEGEVGIKAF
ncbi:MAG: hypothetical protein CVV50_01900 [Spirochaetae bacterium HGW-Spirochaetae-6]|nr:MAG: hypothetical protein CVV50_01900 [Spirochaetae bacterium HGW-Spirochaetae-6]